VLGSKDAKTELIDGSIKITVKKSVDFQATCGDSRPRMTLAHELGHAVMHATEGMIDHRASGASGTTTISKIDASTSAEHQAKVFASAFLINDKRAAELGSPTEIAMEFLVSLTAAEICYERIQTEIERTESALRVMKLNNEFQASMKKSAKKTHYLEIPCPSCREEKLIPIGMKILCDSCGYVGDHPQNGDPS
jgi:ribosomal protein S27E